MLSRRTMLCTSVLAATTGLTWVLAETVWAAADTWPRDRILAAIRQVESSGRPNPPDGDGGRAIGPYQIHEVYWRDAVEFAADLKPRGYQACRQQAYAEQIIDAYMRRYATRPWARGEAETIARIHNGGPQGARKSDTLRYWHKVRALLVTPD